jgi:hypothetical protein
MEDYKNWICGIGILVLPTQPALAMDDYYTEANSCEFPTSLHLGLLNPDTDEPSVMCSGVYVGSGLMLTAAHCAYLIDESGEAFVYFGEDWQNPAWSSSDVNCVRHPAGYKYTNEEEGIDIYRGPDIAYCKLDTGTANDWPEPPIIPVMVPNSCENDYIYEELFSSPPGATSYPGEPFGLNINKIYATASGVGTNQPGCTTKFENGCYSGIKRYVDVPIHPESYSTKTKSILFPIIQPDPVALRPGDSGGPLYFRMYDNSWRLIGTNSYNYKRLIYVYNPETNVLEQEEFLISLYTGTPRYVGWIEASSERDITPCHTYNSSTGRWDFTGGTGCANNVPKSDTAGDGYWFVGNGDNITACLSYPLVYESDACAGWTPPPFEPPIAAPGLPDTQSGSALLLAVEGEMPFLEAEPSAEGLGLFRKANPKHEVYGTADKDVLHGSDGDDAVIAGSGPDIVHGHEGDDDLMGNHGDDHIMGGVGNDLIIPGHGRDKVNAGSGDDIVVIQGTCELEEGEVLVGGDGIDTLVSPLTTDELMIAGVIANEFETFIPTHPDSEMWTCDPQPVDIEYFVYNYKSLNIIN